MENSLVNFIFVAVSLGTGSFTIAISILFWLTPVALTIHLAIKKAESQDYKKRLGYIYGSLWAIAFLGYGWLYIS